MNDSFQFKQLCENSHRTLVEIRDEIDTKDDLYVKDEIDDRTDIKPSLLKSDSDRDDNDDDVQDIGNDVEDAENDSCDDEWLSDRIENSKTKRSQLDPNKCDPQTLTCKTCDKKLSTVGSLLRHLNSHESKRYDICKKGFYEERYLSSHMKRHQNETRFVSTLY